MGMEVGLATNHAEREWDFGALAQFLPCGDGLDGHRAFGSTEAIESLRPEGEETEEE